MKAIQFLNDFQQKGWGMPNIYERLYEFIDDPAQVFEFCKCFMFQEKKSTTFFKDSLSFLTLNDLQKIIILTFENIDDISLEITQEIISHTSLQAPNFLHPYLPVIFDRKINRSSYVSGFPWRYLPEKEIDFFKHKLINSTDEEDQRELINCLLETRHLPTLYFVQDFIKEFSFLKFDFTYYIEKVGFTIRNNKIENYCPNGIFHFIFPKKYFLPHKNIALNRDKHPTWLLPTDGNIHTMGGVIEADEKNPFLHLLTLNPIPESVKISLRKVIFGVHIREITEGYGAIFYQHDSEGNPTRIGEINVVQTDFDFPFLPCKIELSPTPERWKNQDCGVSNSRENLFRLGGEPTWVQGSEVLTCPVSGEKMDFLFQLDSELPDIKDSELYFGDAGILYAFWCDKSRVSGYIAQWT